VACAFWASKEIQVDFVIHSAKWLENPALPGFV